MGIESKSERGGVEQMEMDASKKIPYPKGVFFIMATELSERFSYYGMRAVLTIYMRNKLNFSEDTATSYYHIFLMICYGLPMFWGVVSDSWLGKFKTIFYVSILFALGNIVLALSSVPPLNLPTEAFFFVGLFLMGVGTSGMKPCVAPLGGEQFVLPQQANYLRQFFSLFFFAITIGNMVSTLITPVFRRDVTCFGSDSCYPLAFGVPAMIMIVAVVTFLAGRPLYTVHKPTSGNMLVKVSKCVAHAISNRGKKNQGAKESAHWLDSASDLYDEKLIADTKGLLRVLVYYLPIPIFFALYEQLGSRWTLQATRMKGALGSFIIKPDQMQVSNALLMFIFLPVFQYIVYPIMGKFGIFKRPLQRMVVGGILAGLSFTVAGIVELQIEPSIKPDMVDGQSVLHLVNGLPCPVNVWVNPARNTEQSYSIEGDNYLTLPALHFDEKVEFLVKTKENCVVKNKTLEWSGFVNVLQGAYQTVAISLEDNPDHSISVNSFPFGDDHIKSKDGNARVRFIVIQDPDSSLNQTELSITPTKGGKSSSFTLKRSGDVLYSGVEEIGEKKYTVYLPSTNANIVDGRVDLKNGGSYSIILYNGFNPGEIRSQVVTITPENNIHILWLLPQYMLMAWGEILFIVSGMEFSFTEAPVSMKSVLQALWHFMNACGNVIVIIAAQGHGKGSQSVQFFMFAGLMFIDSIIFAFMAMRYKYVSSEDAKPVAAH